MVEGPIILIVATVLHSTLRYSAFRGSLGLEWDGCVDVYKEGVVSLECQRGGGGLLKAEPTRVRD